MKTFNFYPISVRQIKNPDTARTEESFHEFLCHLFLLTIFHFFRASLPSIFPYPDQHFTNNF